MEFNVEREKKKKKRYGRRCPSRSVFGTLVVLLQKKCRLSRPFKYHRRM